MEMDESSLATSTTGEAVSNISPPCSRATSRRRESERGAEVKAGASAAVQTGDAEGTAAGGGARSDPCMRRKVRRWGCGLLGGVTGCGCCTIAYERPWEGNEKEQVTDLNFVVYTLRRKNKEFARYRDLVVYLLFLAVFAQTLLAGKGLDDGFWTVATVGVVTAEAEFDQGPLTGLYFQKTFDDIGQEDEWYQFMKSSQSMQSLIGQPYNAVQGQNHLLSIIRLRQLRVHEQEPRDCSQADDYLHGNWTGWVHCHLDWNTGERFAPIPRASGAGVDVCGRDRMGRSPFEWNAVQQTWPGHDSATVTVEGRHGTYPVNGFFFDLYADMNLTDYLDTIACLEREGWVDQAATRTLEVQFYTYNPASNLFIEMRLLTEVTAAGLMETVVRPRVFVMFNPQGYSLGMEVALLVGIAWYTFKLGLEIYINVYMTKRAFIWMFSVWRLVEIFNLCVFIWVSVIKIRYFLMPTLELRYHPIHSHESVRTHEYMASKGEAFYNDAVFARLEDYAFHMHRILILSSFNGCLSFLKLFKFFSLSPYFNLLTETIKESIASLLALLMYLFIITNAFAIMGLVVFGAQLEAWASYDRCLRSLFISLLGDFDYGALMNVSRRYVDLFFFGYQVLTWLILINMTISIISEGFQHAKERQSKAVGEVPLAVVLREWWSWVETQVVSLCCCGATQEKQSKVKTLPSSIVHWNHVAGMSTGDIVFALHGAHEKEGWLKLHTSEEVGGVELRRACGRSRWFKESQMEECGEWEACSWEHTQLGPAVEMPNGCIVVFPAARRDALVVAMNECWHSGDPSEEDALRTSHVADALCWYFDPVNLTRDSVYQAWVFYNEVQIPRDEYTQPDNRGAKPFQVRYLAEMDGEEECTPLGGCVRDEAASIRRNLNREPRSERLGSEGPRIREKISGDVQKMLRILAQQGVVLDALAEGGPSIEGLTHSVEGSQDEVTPDTQSLVSPAAPGRPSHPGWSSPPF
eukprot:Hpha_TRINITY_DN10162_c0_g1::TRINITY_DN10162_c0_g1_i1::g.131606::m.131606/K04990/PKD2L1; polycystin 2L1